MPYKKLYRTKKGTTTIEKKRGTRIVGKGCKIDSYIIKTAEKQGVRIYPSAISLAKSQVNKSVRSGIIKNRRERILGGSALILSAVSKAKSEGQTMVTAGHIKKGWKSLRRCPGNLPPHLCMGRSIIKAEPELRQSLPGLTEILNFTENIDEE